MQFLIALAVVVGGLWLIRKAAKMPPQAARNFAQKLGGGAIIAFAGLLTLRGQMQIAIPMFLFGAGLIGKTSAFPNGFSWGGKSRGQKSRVATTLLTMELDHDSGTMDGEVLNGPSKGRRLSQLNETDLRAFHLLCTGSGDQSRALFEAWLDRNKPEWRGAWGQGGAAAQSSSGPMSREEALAVLGLKTGASEEEIRAAHRRLMKDFHPDKGGSDYLAAKINAAKDKLLG
ncbi:DnaJ domain-containing protein [Aestuariivirga sp.]|uniref:DnaJ domain-containing protein n=1 Tax=Aestuariivirga sp. TaxID=2650926 RepID=UPI0039E5D23B